jgi:hypothetical protein
LVSYGWPHHGRPKLHITLQVVAYFRSIRVPFTNHRPTGENNPDFCAMNKVIMLYCDGTSFSGDRDDPVIVNGKPLHFRGKVS